MGVARSSSSPPAEGAALAAARLIRSLDASEQYRRDGPLGGIFHPGRISYRELAPRNSLHIIIDGNRVSAHVDEVCPLRCRPGAPATYSWPRVVAHNVSGAVADLGRRLRGLHGAQRCNFGCEAVWVDDDIAGFTDGLDTGTSSATDGGSEESV